MQKRLKRTAVSVLGVCLTTIFPVIFLYGNNSNEVNLQEVFKPAVLAAVVALVLFALCTVIMRDMDKSASVPVLFCTGYRAKASHTVLR